MSVNHNRHHRPQFRVLSDEQIEKIYQASLHCLNCTGVDVLNAEARELLTGSGARSDGVRVRIPPHIIQDAVVATPRSFTLWGRNSEHSIQVQSPELIEGVLDRVHFGPGPTCTYFVDPITGERRKSGRGDPGMTALVCDALDNIDYVMGLGLIDDVVPALAPVYEFAEMISNTGKPVLFWAYTLQEVVDIYRIAVAVAGSEKALRQHPFFALFSTFQSPLQHTDHDLENVLWAVERDIPIVYLGGPIVGLTSPSTGASSLVIHLAEALSGLAIIQLKKRGAPVVIGGVPHAMDLRTARPSYGSPEMSLYSAAASDISRFLGFPFMGTAGASDSKLLDSQAAIESTIQVLMSALSGATLVHDVGFTDCADIGSLPLLVMSDEIIAMVRRIMRGVEVNDDSLMLDLIDQVGPGGHFVAEPRSANLCRQEIWVPQLMDRNAHSSWVRSGKKSMEERVWERVREILRTHEPPPLPEGAAKQIEAILQEAEERENRD